MTLAQRPGTAAATSFVAALASSAVHGAHASPKTYEFHGTVESVDSASKSATVAGEDVPGWMAAMTMVFRLDKPEALAQLKKGDRIVATVKDGDVTTVRVR